MPPVLQPAASCRCLPPLTAARGVDAHLRPCARRPGGAATGRGGLSLGLFLALRVNWSLLEERHLSARATRRPGAWPHSVLSPVRAPIGWHRYGTHARLLPDHHARRTGA